MVKRYNVFVEYHNRMESFEYTRGDMTKEMKISEDIIELYQKERFDQLKINHPIVIIGVHLRRLSRMILEIVKRQFLQFVRGGFRSRICWLFGYLVIHDEAVNNQITKNFEIMCRKPVPVIMSPPELYFQFLPVNTRIMHL